MRTHAGFASPFPIGVDASALTGGLRGVGRLGRVAVSWRVEVGNENSIVCIDHNHIIQSIGGKQAVIAQYQTIGSVAGHHIAVKDIAMVILGQKVIK